MVERLHISRTQLVNQILRIGHGQLEHYTAVGLQAVREEPELFAHLIAWNSLKGEVRDSKVALPVIALRGKYDAELTENAVAHLMQLDPRNLVRAIEYGKKFNSFPVSPGAGRLLKRGIYEYLKAREGHSGWWTRTVLQHRKSMKALYALFHVKPDDYVQDVLFKNKKPKGSVFEAISLLKNMSPQEAAGTILNHKIPFLIAVGAVGGVKNKPDIILALMEHMTGSEVVNNAKALERLGVMDNPALKAAFSAALERAKQDKRLSTLKAGKAAEVVKDKKTADKMKAVQADKLDKLGGIEGNWLILADRSGSMHQSIVLARQVAALIAQQVKGDVHLVFFNVDPTAFVVSGMDLTGINNMTRHMTAGGGTCIGCGLEFLRFKNIEVNGIVIISDGGENTRPAFTEAYSKYVDSIGIEPTVYHLWTPGEQNVLDGNMDRAGVQYQIFDVSNMDYYSLPNLVKTLRSNRYSLVDEILATPLLKMSDTLKRKEYQA